MGENHILYQCCIPGGSTSVLATEPALPMNSTTFQTLTVNNACTGCKNTLALMTSEQESPKNTLNYKRTDRHACSQVRYFRFKCRFT